MSPRTSSSRRPAESDVYTALLIVAALFLLAADLLIFLRAQDWYELGKGELAQQFPTAP